MIMLPCSPKPLTLVEHMFFVFLRPHKASIFVSAHNTIIFQANFSPNTTKRNPLDCVQFWVWLRNSVEHNLMGWIQLGSICLEIVLTKKSEFNFDL